MNRSLLLLPGFLLLNNILSAQGTALYEPYEFPSKVPAKYIVNAENEYNVQVQRKMKKVSSGVNHRFAEASTFSKKELFTSGGVYMGWEEMEKYINEVIAQIIPPTIQDRSSVIGYLSREADANAYAMHDGTILVNIGLLADVVNEAGLAIILGHELTHFINQDAKRGFVKEIKLYSKKNRKNNLELAIDGAHSIQEYEKEADLKGFMIAEAGGYDLYYGISNFNQFKAEEEVYNLKKAKSRLKTDTLGIVISKKKKYSEPLEKLLSTHPSMEDRIAFLEEYLKSADRTNNKKDFIVSKPVFQKLQKLARLETVNLLFEDNNYRGCIERSFIYHLAEPDNINYIYFVLESIRRIIYLDSRMKNKGFLTEDNKSGRFKKGEGVLHDLSFLVRDSLQMAAIKQNALLDTSVVEFETYGQALDYFSKTALERNISESLLSLALYQPDEIKRNEFLNLYIAKPDAAKKEFARALLDKKLHASLDSNTREVVLIDKIDFFQERNSGLHERKMYSLKKSPRFYKTIKEKIDTHYVHKEVIVLEYMENENLKMTLEFYNAIDASMYTKEASKTKIDEYYSELEKDETKQKGIDYFILKPELWYFMKNNRISSIEYAHLAQYDDRGAVAAYFNPLFVIFFPYWLLARPFGSDRYVHYLYYYNFDVKSQKQHYFEITKDWKLTPNRSYKRMVKAIASKNTPKSDRELVGVIGCIPIYMKKK